MPGFSSLWPQDPNHLSLQAPPHGAAEGWQQGVAAASSSTLPLLRLGCYLGPQDSDLTLVMKEGEGEGGWEQGGFLIGRERRRELLGGWGDPESSWSGDTVGRESLPWEGPGSLGTFLRETQGKVQVSWDFNSFLSEEE